MRMSHEEAQVFIGMMESLWGIQFFDESGNQVHAAAGEIIASYTDFKGRSWVARCNNPSSLNPAQIDSAKQALEYISTTR